MQKAQVCLFHAVDTEGPLFESAVETVERINRSTGLDLPLTRQTLSGLIEGNVELGSYDEVVQLILKYSSFLGDWHSVKAMLNNIMSQKFRLENSDSYGRPWIYNWHVMDHIGYDVNPRHRDIGYHNIFDTYKELIEGSEDELGFHFHPDHYYTHAHLCGTNYNTSRYLYSILTRRLIDRNWFPNSYRAGFHTERPDSHLFLEQWIPHDFSNLAIEGDNSTAGQLDLADHRFGDWSRAPTQWGYYHPHHDDYQSSGACRRRIFRCLNIGTRHRCITEDEVRKAFELAKATGESVLVAVTNHDFREMAPDVQWLKAVFDKLSIENSIPWKTCNITDTFSSWKKPPVECKWNLEREEKRVRLSISYSADIFGPQPFMALKLVNEIYHHVNFDIIKPFREFSYVFDENTVEFSKLESLVVGTNDKNGNVIITRIIG
jgi:hypothetical protein